MAAALVTAQADVASARVELRSLRRRVDDAEAVARQNTEEVLQRRTLEREHAPMLQDLRNRANTALGHICDVDAPAPKRIEENFVLRSKEREEAI